MRASELLQGYLARPAAIALALLFTSGSLAQGTSGPNVIIGLRLTGNRAALPQLGSCLASKLLQMPDIEIVPPPAHGVRFTIDLVATRGPGHALFASFVIAQTFPVEQFRPRLKKGDDADALLTAMHYYTLLRLHEIVPGHSTRQVCATVAADIANKVLSREYTERND